MKKTSKRNKHIKLKTIGVGVWVLCVAVPIILTAKTENKPVASTTITEEVTNPAVTLYDVPLSEDLQLHIIKTCEEKGIDPVIVFAMAYRESSYRTDAVGDNCASLGLLQIQSRWHSERMERLDCPNLLDPYQNVTVGVDYLAELLDRYGDIPKALTAYNTGHYKGKITNYAKNVLVTAEELRGKTYVYNG